MRLILTCLITIQSYILFSQNSYGTKLFPKGYTAITQEQHLVTNDIEALNYIQIHSTISNPSIRLQFAYKRSSQCATHYIFQQYYNDIPVYNGEVKLSVALNNIPVSIFNNLQNHPNPKTAVNSNQTNDYVWFVSNDNWQLLQRKIIKNTEGPFIEQLVSNSDQIIHQKELCFRDKKDTLLSLKVFNPDPLTSARKLYGDENGIWSNHNAQDFPEINNQRQSLPIWLSFENDTFRMQNKYVTISDLERPNITPFTCTNADSLIVTRSSSAFTEEMILRHVYYYHERLNRINFHACDTAHHPIDAHAANGNDDSRFDYGPLGPSLYFGTGGVPDAEDADVITHEYTHAMGDMIAPNSSDGTERMGIEEGGCDFMACLYSREWSDYNWRSVFNWDGHNEFWQGRNGDIQKLYSPENVSDFYKGAEIWCSMLNDMATIIPSDSMLKLYLNFMFQYSNNMSMMDGNIMLLQTDSLLFNKRYQNGLKFCMQKRGFDITANINNVSLNDNIILINSSGFSMGEANLQVKSLNKVPLHYEIIDMLGRVVDSNLNNILELELRPENLNSGQYILKITDAKNQMIYIKIQRN